MASIVPNIIPKYPYPKSPEVRPGQNPTGYQNSPYGNLQGYDDVFNSTLGSNTPGWDSNRINKTFGGYGTQFSDLFRQLTGRAPTDQEMSDFFQNIVGGQVQDSAKGFSGTNYNDMQNLDTAYLKNKMGSEIDQHQLDVTQKRTQDVIDRQTQDTIKYLTNPEVMQKIQGSFNQKGLLNSGAFTSGITDKLTAGASNADINALTQTTLPMIGSMNPLNPTPGLSAYGQSQDGPLAFDKQSDLARQIAEMSSPSGLQQWAPIIQGALQGGGAAAGGTYLCTHLSNLGIMTKEEVKNVHKKIFPYAFLHPLDLLLYGFFAPAFILRADAIGFDWKWLKPQVCDKILECKTAREAFKQYKSICLEIFTLMGVCHG